MALLQALRHQSPALQQLLRLAGGLSAQAGSFASGASCSFSTQQQEKGEQGETIDFGEYHNGSPGCSDLQH